MGQFNDTGYSARVRIWLECEGHRIPLAQTSATFVIANRPIELPPESCARIVFTVDEEEYRREVTLVNGMKIDHDETMVLDRDHLPF